MARSFEFTNLHGIGTIEITDNYYELSFVYDNGDRYRQTVLMPHAEKHYPAGRKRWTFVSKGRET